MLQLINYIFLATLIVNCKMFAKELPVYPLPSFITRPCPVDENINTCYVEVGAPAIKAVVKGDPKYKIPKLDPLLIKEIKIQQGTKQIGLKLICKECYLWGLHNTVFTKANVDIKRGHIQWDFTLDKLKIKGKYSISGQVLLLPITGNGDAQIDLENLRFSFIFDQIREKKSNGYQYVKITNGTFPIEVGHMKIQLDNLFNGDKLLGENMNNFMNEHWKDIFDDLGPAFSESLGELTKTVINNMATLVPFEILHGIKKN